MAKHYDPDPDEMLTTAAAAVSAAAPAAATTAKPRMLACLTCTCGASFVRSARQAAKHLYASPIGEHAITTSMCEVTV